MLADAVSAKVRAHQGLARALQRLAGVALLGFGIKLATP
jgi:threonine/homoserine/homoserine lactone efflux protein